MRAKLTILAVAALALLAVALPVVAQGGPLDAEGPNATDTVVIAGADRYDTAAQIALGAGTASAQVLYIANGETAIDAIAVGVSAQSLTSKLLLVTRDDVPDATEHALRQIRHAKLVFLGGPDVISPAVRDEVASLTCNYATGTC